ncbi:MAG: dephospho-CoA kinase [Nanoarchaeota archaeon]
MIIGITGNLGSGKSTIVKLFKEHGFKIISADKIGHKEINKIFDELKRKFGKKIFFKGRIDRKRLGKLVFSDKRKLKMLQKITWPLIIRKIKEEIKKNDGRDIVIESALIIESGLKNLVDRLVLVKIDKDVQLKRLLKKNRYTEEEIRNILKLQLRQEEKIKYVDYVVDNGGDIENTKSQIVKLIGELRDEGKIYIDVPLV